MWYYQSMPAVFLLRWGPGASRSHRSHRTTRPAVYGFGGHQFVMESEPPSKKENVTDRCGGERCHYYEASLSVSTHFVVASPAERDWTAKKHSAQSFSSTQNGRDWSRSLNR